MANEPYRNEKEALRAKVAALESDLADARDALKKRASKHEGKKDERVSEKRAKTKRASEKASASELHTLASRLLGGPSEISERRSVEGVLGAGGHEAIESRIRQRKGGAGHGAVIGSKFQYTVHDARTDTRLFEVGVWAREGRTVIEAREVVHHVLALTQLCGTFVVGSMGAFWLWFMMRAHIVASLSWLALMYGASRLIAGTIVESKRRALRSLADEVAEQSIEFAGRGRPRRRTRISAVAEKKPLPEAPLGKAETEADADANPVRTRRR